MKTLLLSLAYIVGIAELLLAWFFYKTRSGNEVRKVMSVLALTTGFWVITTAMNSYVVPNATTILVDKFIYSLGVFLVTALFNLALLFPFPLLRLDKLHYVLLYIPAILFSVMVFQDGIIVGEYYSSPTHSGTWYGGPLYFLYNSYLLIGYIAATAILIYKHNKSDGLFRKNLAIVVWSFLLGGLPAVIFDLIVPLVTGSAIYPLVGTISTVFWLGMTSYIVVRK